MLLTDNNNKYVRRTRRTLSTEITNTVTLDDGVVDVREPVSLQQYRGRLPLPLLMFWSVRRLHTIERNGSRDCIKYSGGTCPTGD